MSELYTKAAQTILCATALALMLGLAAACQRPPGDESPGEGSVAVASAIPVEFVAVTRADMVNTLVATTTVRSAQSAAIQSRAAGRLAGFGLTPGAAVQSGATIARVDAPELAAARDEAQAALRRAEAAVADLEPLLAQGYVARRVHDDAVAATEQARAQLDRAALALRDLAVVSPLGGVVTEVLVADGELVMPNQTLARVVSLDALEAVAAVPEREASVLYAGLTALLAPAGLDAPPVQATVTHVAPVVDARVGTIDVTIRPQGTAAWLRPGTLVSVGIVVDTRADVPVIPKRAIVWEADEPWVFVVQSTPDAEGSGAGDSAVERRRLVLGYEDARRVEVREGLSEHDRVIVTGQTALESGDRVELVTERTDLMEAPGLP